MINSGNIKLAAIKGEVYMDCLIAAGVIGIVGGLVGSLFIRVNNMVNLLRKKFLTTKFHKIAEALILTAITVSTFFASAYYRQFCLSDDD